MLTLIGTLVKCRSHEPTGYQRITTNSLSEPAIKHGRSFYKTLCRTGVAVPLLDELAPDLIWVKVEMIQITMFW